MILEAEFNGTGEVGEDDGEGSDTAEGWDDLLMEGEDETVEMDSDESDED